MDVKMAETAKLFNSGRSQAVKKYPPVIKNLLAMKMMKSV